ncbi:MAG: monomeric [FeFe] hydrogenase [Spirochaetaceae bacterium]|jgi:[FeFe] hydrogenase (group B1/B3)|nr:monomeric [FeFe] hydrogenase [Spirochaetaceae bacterium]
MLTINNNTARLKREILVRIARFQLAGKLSEGVHSIPRELAPAGSPSIRCCAYHDREILRQRVIARLGCSLEEYDEEKRLADYVTEALAREKPTWPMLTVLDLACNACVRAHFMVTNACQACLARPCLANCGKKAIAITGGRAHIDEEKCVNCGLCLHNCPYHAIIQIPVPCEESCPVGAVARGEKGKQRIDYHKCIFCGNCMRECPFGAMMDKSQLVDVIKHILAQKTVIALYAPAAASQFRTAPGQLEGALLAAGFSQVLEVAWGADITAEKEAAEFTERLEKGETMMTTSCCPAYVRAVRRHTPALEDCISSTRTPLHYTAEIAKKENPQGITVFIGPCLAKRREGMDDEYVDYVISIEELHALFIAKEIDPAKAAPAPGKRLPTSWGRNFAKSGGVAQAVKARLKEPSRLKETLIDGLDKAGMQRLAEFGKIHSGAVPPGPDTPNLIEVMACKGGCIAGPSVIINPKAAISQLTKYAEKGL